MHSPQQLDQRAALGLVQARCGRAGQALAQALHGVHLRLGGVGELQPRDAAVVLVGGGLQQAAFAQALQQAGDLALVAAGVGSQLALRGAWVAGEEAQGAGLQRRELRAAVAQRLVVAGAQQTTM